MEGSGLKIPTEIMAIARDLIGSAAFEQFPDGTFPDAAYERVAHAILAERQRCADVATREREAWYDHDGELLGPDVAAAILAGENHE